MHYTLRRPGALLFLTTGVSVMAFAITRVVPGLEPRIKRGHRRGRKAS
jgi:hypothetical protein